VSRKHLLARLDEGLEYKLTLLSAPAGAGKTTLVAEWLNQITNDGLGMMKDESSTSSIHHTGPVGSSFITSHSRAAWVALDTGDNDPVRFWRYAITACQVFDAAVGRSSLPLLLTSQEPPFETVLTTFINELTQLPCKGILILEDYHVITSPQLHELITFLLEHLPTTLHLIIITRSDPPLPLARLRAHNNLNELRTDDLRFSLAEIQTFLQQTIQLSLSTEVVERLEVRTEGWVAGLRLVALALQGRQDPQEVEQFLVNVSGSHGHILEYLVEEVLCTQPQPLQEFLLQTTFLSRLTGSLCDTITGKNDSALILEQLERTNLFLIPLDDAGQWYRYHALFAEAMHYYARRRFGEAGLAALYEKASFWYEQHGLLAEAIEASLSAQKFVRAADLIERIIAPGLVHNEHHTVRRWIKRLPEEVLYKHPTLCLAYAIAVLFTSDRRAPATRAILQEPLDVAEQTWQAEDNQPKLGQVLAFRALVDWLQGDTVRAFAGARQALNLLPEANVEWRGISLIFVGVEELVAGKLTVARQTLLQARALCEASGNIYGTLDSTLILGQICIGQGELHQAAQFYQQVFTRTEQAPMDRIQALNRKGRSLIGLGLLDLEWNALETAEQRASQALDLRGQSADEELLGQSSLLLARVLHARGEIGQAQQLLHELVAQIKQPLLLREAQMVLARLALVSGDLAPVQRWSNTIAQAGDDLPLLQQEQERLLVARLLLAQGQAEAALQLLEIWQAEAHTQGRTDNELEIMSLKALAYFIGNNLSQAGQSLYEALTLAHLEGYRRLFLDEGEKMAALLQAILPDLKEEPLIDYAQSLLADFGFSIVDFRLEDESRIPNPKSQIENLVESLSPQEERVLRLLVAGLSNQEIARELIVSVNTIKTQVKSIYRKLDVHSRRDARTTARRLNLL
jgi:LuxR family maltose regulon positive regulatory protein